MNDLKGKFVEAQPKTEVAGRHRSSEVCRTLGITYRQLDYWSRSGLIRPFREGQNSGVWRLISDEEVDRARLIRDLHRAGVEFSAIRRALLDDVERMRLATRLRGAAVLLETF